MGASGVDAVGVRVDFEMGAREETSKVRREPLFSVGALERASTSSLLSELTGGGLIDREFQ